MWPISTALPRREGLAADGVELAFVDVADVGDEGGFEVAHGSDVAEMVLLFVGSGDEVGAAFEGLVEDDEGAGLFGMRCGFEADGAEVAGGGLEGGCESLRGSWGGVRRTVDAGDESFGFVEGVIAAEEDDDWAGVCRQPRDESSGSGQPRACRPWFLAGGGAAC